LSKPIAGQGRGNLEDAHSIVPAKRHYPEIRPITGDGIPPLHATLLAKLRQSPQVGTAHAPTTIFDFKWNQTTADIGNTS
jgi:hypothetical protein